MRYVPKYAIFRLKNSFFSGKEAYAPSQIISEFFLNPFSTPSLKIKLHPRPRVQSLSKNPLYAYDRIYYSIPTSHLNVIVIYLALGVTVLSAHLPNHIS